MIAALIAQLVQIAISLAKTQLNGKNVELALVNIVQSGVQAYEDHTGRPLDPQLIKPEAAL